MTDLPSLPTAVPARLGVTASHSDAAGLALHLEPDATLLHHGIVRASVLAYLVDAVAGITVDADESAWTFTTDLTVRMRPVPAPAALTATTELLRSGRRSATLRVAVVDGAGAEVATGAIGFAHVPRKPDDPPKPMVPPAEAPALFSRARARIERPLRDEAGVVVLDPTAGVVEIAVTPDVCNPAGTLQGAMVALVAEVAAEELVGSRSGGPVVVVDLDIRYLDRATVGPVRTRCRALGDEPTAPIEVELVDTSVDRVTTLVHARAVAL